MRIFFLFLLWILCNASAASEHPAYGLDWNREQIDWQTYQEAVEQAGATGKPVLVVLYAPWCPTCHMYEGVFRNPEVTALTDDWVMTRIDVSTNGKLAESFAEDGIYTPRVYVVGADGIDRPIYSKHRLKHFFPPKLEVFVHLLEQGRALRQEVSS